MSAVAVRGRLLTRSVTRERAGVIALVAITALAALLRFWDLGPQGYWHDEVDPVVLAHGSLASAWHPLARIEFPPPLYFAGAWVWGHVFGFDEFGLRAFSALAGTA